MHVNMRAHRRFIFEFLDNKAANLVLQCWIETEASSTLLTLMWSSPKGERERERERVRESTHACALTHTHSVIHSIVFSPKSDNNKRSFSTSQLLGAMHSELSSDVIENAELGHQSTRVQIMAHQLSLPSALRQLGNFCFLIHQIQVINNPYLPKLCAQT